MTLSRALYLLTAAVVTHFLVRDWSDRDPATNLSPFKTFICTYFALSFLWLVYARYLVPKWLSPLLKLPQPKVKRIIIFYLCLSGKNADD